MKDIYLSLLIGFFFGIQIRMVYRRDRDDEIYYLASFLHNFFTPCRFLLSRIRGALCIIKDLTCIWKIIGFTLNTSTSLSLCPMPEIKRRSSHRLLHTEAKFDFLGVQQICTYLYVEKLSWWWYWINSLSWMLMLLSESFETEKQNFTFFPQSVTVAYERWTCKFCWCRKHHTIQGRHRKMRNFVNFLSCSAQ